MPNLLMGKEITMTAPLRLRASPIVLHIHATFLPATEHWICRLLAGTKGFRHVAVSEQLSQAPPLSCANIRHLPHGLERATAARHDVRPWIRYTAALRLLLAGGPVGASLRSIQAQKVVPTIVHAHFGDVAWRWRRLINRLDAPLVVSFYGYDYATLPHRDPRWRARLRWVFAKAALLLAEGPHAARRLVDLGADPVTVRVVNLGTVVPIDEPDAPQRSGARFLQLASLTEKKGQLFTISAFEQIAASHPDATLSLVGSGETAYAKTVRHAIASSPYAHRIRLQPFVEYDDLPPLFANADYFVQPSATAPDGDSEGGAPVALLDAQAHGLPVIVSTHCDLPYVSAELGWNRPVEEGHVDALARTMAAALAIPVAQRDADRRTVARFTREHFDVRLWSAKLEALYQSLL